MLNMGGPNDLDEVGPFLHNLFSDGEIITLGPLQNILGRFLLGPPSSSFVLPHSTSHHTPLLTFIAWFSQTLSTPIPVMFILS